LIRFSSLEDLGDEVLEDSFCDTFEISHWYLKCFDGNLLFILGEFGEYLSILG
jgi:hypothetical protein